MKKEFWLDLTEVTASAFWSAFWVMGIFVIIGTGIGLAFGSACLIIQFCLILGGMK